MSTSELISQLRTAGDPLDVRAADALVVCQAEVERLRIRVQLLEGVARLNGDTIRNMQRPAAEAATDTGRSLHAERITNNNGGCHAYGQSDPSTETG